MLTCVPPHVLTLPCSCPVSGLPAQQVPGLHELHQGGGGQGHVPTNVPCLAHAVVSGPPARRFLYYMSYIKVAVAMAMYLPQVLLNHERRSTAGFSIEQVPSGELLCVGTLYVMLWRGAVALEACSASVV